jgi:hypothetical protein
MVLRRHVLAGLAFGAYRDSELTLAATLWPELPDASEEALRSKTPARVTQEVWGLAIGWAPCPRIRTKTADSPRETPAELTK